MFIALSKRILLIAALTGALFALEVVVCSAQSQKILFTGTEGSNANASNGSAPRRNAYTNCANGYSGGQLQPAGFPVGQLYCTTAEQTAAEGAGGPVQGVVSATITGTGTTALDNGKGAGGTDSLSSLTVTYAGAYAGACNVGTNTPSALNPNLILPGTNANAETVYSGTTANSNFNTSLLAPTKWTFTGGDGAYYYVRQTCQTVPVTTGTGFHLEFDLNHTLSNHDYIGLGMHYSWATSEWSYCPQGCSSWKPMNLVESNGTVHTTFSFPAAHDIYTEFYGHRSPSCSSSSPVNCEFYDNLCIKDFTAGGSLVCYQLVDRASGQTPGGIPVNLPGFAANEINLQHQLDFNQASNTGSVNVHYDNVVAYAPAWSGLIAGNRAIDWSSAGATIETRNTQCGSTIAAGASAATIQAAITACAGSHQYVLLGPGTFTLNTSLIITYAGALNVTLRGSGPTQTILAFTGSTTNCDANGPTAICITNGDSQNTANGSTNTLNWTAGYAAGTTVLTAGSAVTGSLSNMHVGTLLYLTQADENSDNGQWWACGSTGANGDCSQQGMENQWPARSTSQTVTVTNIAGSSITISPGVYAPDYASGRVPYMSFSSFLPISGFGLENLTVDTQNFPISSRMWAMVEYGWALNCWIKNVSLINSVSPNGAIHNHVFIGSSQHITVRDSYMYGSSPTMEGYGVDTTLASSDNLIENNISNHVATAFMFESASGNVLGYNFVTDNFYVGNPPGSAPNWQGTDTSFHDAGNYYNLIEGNEAIQFSSDDIHGTAFANTMFRSYYNGRDPATQCPGGGNACGTGTKTQDTQSVQINSFNRYFNLVANVFGTSGYFTNYQQQGVTGSPNSCTSSNWTTIFNLNYGASWLQPWSPACGNGSSWTIDNDDKVSSSLMRWGNYDTVTGAVRTNGGETASGASAYPGLSSPSTAWASYPSLYLSAQPSWWKVASNSPPPWPAIGPDVSGGDVANVGGHVYLNPAARCYSFLGGRNDGSTGSLQASFDAAICYPSGAGTNYTNTVTLSGSGTGSASGTNCVAGTNSYNSGTSISCTFTATGGSSLTSVSGTGSASSCVASPCSYTLTNNSTITATFNPPALVCGDPSQSAPNFSGTYYVPPTTLPVNVQFSSPTAGCTMHYTADGSAPTCGSASYPGGGFNVSSTGSHVYRVIACQGGYTSSNIVGGNWVISIVSVPSLSMTGAVVTSGTVGLLQ